MTQVIQFFSLKYMSEFLNKYINWIYKNIWVDYNLLQQLLVFITFQQFY